MATKKQDALIIYHSEKILNLGLYQVKEAEIVLSLISTNS